MALDNQAQARYASLLDDLTALHPAHLHSFIDGIQNPEPPHYELINGKVQPTLQPVTLERGCNCYDFGNIQFSNDSAIVRVEVVIENGSVEAFMKDPYDVNDKDNPHAAVLPDSLFLELVEKFKDKFEAIALLTRRINETRAFAFRSPNIPRPKHLFGKVRTSRKFIRLWNMPSDNHLYSRSQHCKKITLKPTDIRLNVSFPHDYQFIHLLTLFEELIPMKRDGDPILPHPTCKRRIFLGTPVPDSVKTETFHTLSDDVKVALFDGVARVCYPKYRE